MIPKDKKKQVATLKKKLKGASELYLATDEDREGEAIAWHLIEVLKPDVPVKRLVFHEITNQPSTQGPRGAARHRPANWSPHRRPAASSTVWSATRCRRCCGASCGPKLSAGRVQSVATRLIVAREEARMRFVESAFCGDRGDAQEARRSERSFSARLAELDGRKVAIGKDFDQETGELKTKALVLDSGQAKALASELVRMRRSRSPRSPRKPFTNRPYPPFMTSTLQQEAGRKLRFNARRTMRTAQSLYENGYITYMRTDSLTLFGRGPVGRSPPGGGALRRRVPARRQPRVYRSKSKSAQEAHEAIRPAGRRFRTPGELKSKLDADQMKLYELIWKRTLASQMKDATGGPHPGPDRGTHRRPGHRDLHHLGQGHHLRRLPPRLRRRLG